MAMLGIPDTRIVDTHTGEIFYIDEVLALENVRMVGDKIDRKDFELYWKTELETNRKTELAPILSSPANLYSMEVVMGPRLITVQFALQDLRFSSSTRKKCVATAISVKNRD